MKTLTVRFALVVAVLLLGGCASGVPAQRGGIATIGKAIMSPFKALTPAAPAMGKAGTGKALEAAGGGEVASITQPDNPGQQSAQNYDYTKEDEITFAAPAVITEETVAKDGAKVVRKTEIPAGSKRVVWESQKVGQTIGAAQKDTARETSALLGSFKWVQGLGVITLLIGAIGFAHPAARLLIGGKDTAVVISLVGVGMIAGPFLLVQYADWFALGILLAAGWWFVSRAKHKEGQLDAIKSVVISSPTSSTSGPKKEA